MNGQIVPNQIGTSVANITYESVYRGKMPPCTLELKVDLQPVLSTELSLRKGVNGLCVDSELVQEVKNGRHQAFTTIVRKYRPLLVKFCYRQTKNIQISEDIVQESLTKSYFKINSFEGRSSFKNWLFKITINTLRNKMRSKHRTFISLDKFSFYFC